jgi:hypothetical protein
MKLVFPMSVTCSAMPLGVPGLDKRVVGEASGMNADEKPVVPLSDAKEDLVHTIASDVWRYS